MNLLLLSLVVSFKIINAEDSEPVTVKEELHQKNVTFNLTRRIIGGRETHETRPYMVYLRPATTTDQQLTDASWLCGGVIIHERYILTSAACIEDAQQFYVVSGTHRWVSPTVTNDDCINYGAKKAIWKCVPKSYVFDGHEFDNISWMVKDIAVVKVEDDFNFKKRVRGCDFIPNKIAYNNISEDYEAPGTIGSIAGWGSTNNFGDVNMQTRATENSPVLLDTDVQLISKKSCKNQWEARYHHIIDEEMICAKDSMNSSPMSEMCEEQQVNCKELVTWNSNEEPTRRLVIDPSQLRVHSTLHSTHTDEARRNKIATGGFCENDHGGPLVVGQGKSGVVVGIVSACLTKELNHKCYGPFLYTSVWKNRHMINCAIFKEMGATCRRLLRQSKTQIVETLLTWPRQSDGMEQAANKSLGTGTATTKLPKSRMAVANLSNIL